MSRWLKITLISVVVIFGLLLSTMLIVPWQIKKQGSHWIAENTARSLTIEKASFNPFTLTVEISGTKLTEQNSDQTFVAFKRLMLSGSVKSIIKQAIILDRVELDDPFVNLELLGKQEFNFSDFTRLGSEKPDPVATEPSKPLYFSLNNIVLTNGSIDFTDKTSEKKSQHKIRELALRVPFVGNIPYLTDKYVEPLLRMLLNGAEIEAEGKLKPFKDSLETNLFLTLDNVDLAYYAFHSPIPLPIDVKQGMLDCEIDLSYKISKSEKPILMLGGELALSDIDLRELDGRELFRMPTLILDLDWADLFVQDFNLVSLDIYEPQIYVDRDKSGRWNFQRIMLPEETAAVAKEESTTEDAAAGSLPLLTIEKLALMDGQIHYRDDFVPSGFVEEIRQINLNLDGFSTHPGKKTAATLKLQTDRDFAIAINGELGINPAVAVVDLTAGTLPLKPYYPYLEGLLTAPIEGVLNLAGQIIYTADSNIQVKQAQLELNDLLVPFSGKDQFTLSDFSMTDSSFDLQQQTISLGTIQLSSGNIKATRLADGSFSPLQLLREQPPTDSAATVKNSEPNQPWKIRAESVDLQKFKLLLTDASLAKEPQVNIPDFTLHAENLSYPIAEKSPFALTAKVGKKGSINVDGTVVHTPLQLQAQTQIKSFPLTFLNNFVPEGIEISFKDGKLYSSLAIHLEQQPEKFSGKFSGKLNVSNFDLRDPIGEGELLTWGNLNLDDIKGEITPFSLHVKEVVLSDYLANIQITPEGRVNLTSITATKAATNLEEANSEQSGIKEVVITEDISPSEPPPDIRIDALTLQGGTVSFIDRHLPSIFSTTMYELGGRVTGLASAEQMQADVDLRGQLENHSPLTVSGKINPLSRDLFADLTLSFKDIDLTPMTPYSGTYLGYVIDKGKLYLDLNYHIEHQKISAKNKVMIDQFTFGDTVESDKATSLPVAFAIALLKDSNDEIHLDVPISGDLSDPDFSIVGVIFTVLKNLLVKAATSPFSLLASMLGGDEDFTGISFASGITTIDEEQLTKLAGLAEMLVKRPALTLEISGFADKELDPEGYRQEQLRQKLVDSKWRKMEEDGNAPASKADVVISTEEHPEVLLEVYKEAEFPRPRSFIGILEKLPAPEMEKLLLTNILAGEEQLQELAKLRAMAVRDALEAVNAEIKPRLFLKKTDIYQPPKDGPASRVEFNISSK
ncbi:MAG: DUF748 domain-containing protein [Desulfuromusa sp.]|jgi:uncharacterized protein involved in outer membrane biogenesis|nr:DUF748 domain-containing protein [Desulfuromusa sp.]